MPDLKTALETALNEWNQQPQETTPVQQAQDQRPEGTRFFARTSDVTRATFDYVRTHPNLKSVSISSALQARGHNRGSVSSLLSQMARCGRLIRTPDGRYSVAVAEYVPIKPSELKAARRRAKKETKSERDAAVKEVVTPPAPVPPAAPAIPAPATNSVDELIDRLTVRQAIELFNKLKGMLA